MTELNTVLYSFTAGATLLAIGQSVHHDASGGARSYALTVLLVLLFLNALGELFLAAGAYHFAPYLAGAQLPIRMLLGPVFYWYTHQLVTSQRFLGRRFWALAILGPVVILLIMLPFASLSTANKLALADPATRDPAHFRLAVITCITASGLFLAFTLTYLVLAFRLQRQHRLRMMGLFADLEHRSLDWLKIMMLVWGLAWGLYALEQAFWVLDIQLPGLRIALALTNALALIAFAYLALNQALLIGKLPAPPPEVDKPRGLNLAPERMARIAQRLHTAVVEERLFTENDLSLRRLAEATATTEHHLSETFSQYLHTNFFHFVNGHRIEAAKRLLSTTDMSITDIAYEVGFNSRSTFNSTFKKSTGLTPSAYRTQALTAPTQDGQWRPQ